MNKLKFNNQNGQLIHYLIFMAQKIKLFNPIPSKEEFFEQGQQIEQSKTSNQTAKTYLIVLKILIFILIVCIIAIYFQARAIIRSESQNSQRLKQAQYFQFTQQQNQKTIQFLNNRLIELTKQKKQIFQVTPKVHPPRIRRAASQKDKFVLPKIIWLYLDTLSDTQTYIAQQCLKNIKHYAQLSGFELRVVDRKGYEKYLPLQVSDQLTNLIWRLQNKKQRDAQLNNKFQRVRQTLIELYLFRWFGGVLIRKEYVFTESLEWLTDIKANILLNTGNPGTKPSYFAFFSILEGPAPTKQNKQAENEVDKYMVTSPAVKDYFFAGVPRGQYIRDLLTKYIELVEESSKMQKKAKSHGIDYQKLNLNDLNNALTIASHIIVLTKQKELSESEEKFKGTFNKFAIDEYGLFTMNANYFADKIQFYFNNRLHYYDNFFNYIAKLPLDEFEDSIGPMRYIANPDPFGQFGSRIESAVKKQGKYSIVEGSFVHKVLFMEKQHDFIVENRQKRNSYATFQKWTTLPKTLWLFWDKGFDNIPVSLEFILKDLIAKAQNNGYTVIKIHEQNCHRYIHPSTLKRIRSVMEAQKMPILPPTKSDFYRLALMSTHGGIYLDCSYIFLEGFKWISEIANEDTKFIFNRFGQVPKVLMQFNPLEGGPFDWKISEKYNTKVAWHIGIQSNLIAANKDSEFLKDWFEEFLRFANSTYEETVTRMTQCGIVSHKWTGSGPGQRYLTVMDALKAVLGCKQMQINRNIQKFGDIKDATDYYKLWTINGFTGIQKFRFYNNYANCQMDDPYDNIMIYRYSQDYVKQIFGLPYKAIKFHNIKQTPLNDFILKHQDNLLLSSHPDSFFMKYIVRYNKQPIIPALL